MLMQNAFEVLMCFCFLCAVAKITSAGDSQGQGRLWRAAVHLRQLLNPTGRALGIPESPVG